MNSSGRPRALFFGTPDFAVPCLRTLIELADVQAVITQPDRPSGRGMKLTPPPVKVVAEAAAIAVWQPTKVRPPEFAESLRALNADIAVVVAYGRILPRAVLDAARLGSVNLHASLLPKYRGAAPIQWSIVNGERETGVSLMQMDEGMDTGPVLAMVRTPIDPVETAGDLGIRLSVMGADLLRTHWPALISASLTSNPQDSAIATMAPMLTKDDGRVRWSESAQAVHDRVRGMSPWPGAYSFVGGDRLKIHRTRVIGREAKLPPGTIVEANARGIIVACGEALVAIDELQPEGAKRLTAEQWLSGRRITDTTTFSETQKVTE